MIVFIQYLRAIAALMVVLYHAIYRTTVYGNNDLPFDIQFGMGGVDIFFMISGFIMYVITIKREANPRDFIIARIIRVVPNYWFWTCVFILSYGVTTLPHLFKSLFFIPSYHPQFAHTPSFIWPPLIQGWTLNYEFFFYLLFTMALVTRNRLRFLTLAITCLYMAGVAFNFKSAPLLVYTNPQLLEFLVGVWIGKIYTCDFSAPAWSGALVTLLGVILFPVFRQHPVPESLFHGAWLIDRGVPSFLLVFGMMILEKNGRIGRNEFFLLLGNISYTLYLSHVFILEEYARIWNQWGLQHLMPDYVLLLSGMILSVMAGIFFYYLIEKPLISGCKRFSRRTLVRLPEREFRAQPGRIE